MSDQTAAPKKRIEWIDALRGFTMILVVFSHVELFTFELDPPLFVNEVFISFRMPLFFFISGFIGYKANVVWNARTWWMMSKKKMLIQLIPTLIFGTVFAYIYSQVDFGAFATHVYKLGYWFTIVLLEMFLLLYSMNFVLYQWDKKESKLYKLIALILLSFVLFLARFKYFPSIIEELYNIFSFRLLFRYFPYFAFGYVCSMYKEIFNKIIEKRSFAAVTIVLFVLLFYIRRTYVSVNIDSSFSFNFLDIVIEMLVGFLGLLIVYNTFRSYSDSFSSDKKVGRALQYIGKRTLDIYLLHYFFLPYLPQVGGMLSKGNNATLELALGGGLSLLVIGVCLLVSNILRTSPVFSEYLFGIKRKS